MNPEVAAQMRIELTEVRREAQRLLSAVQTLEPSAGLSSELKGGLSAIIRKLETKDTFFEIWSMPDDTDTGIAAALSQEQTHLENVAKLIGTYYNTLVEEGLPDGLIFNLISDCQHFTFSRWMDEQEG